MSKTKHLLQWATVLLWLFFSYTAKAQNNPLVTGTVLDENTSPITGATVTAVNISDTTIKYVTVTGVDGIFRFNQLKVNSIYDFRISHIAYQPATYRFAVKEGSNNSIAIRMAGSEAGDLDEVIVVGYGTQKKVNLTGAVNQVNGDDVRDRPVTNISQMLQGVMPNLNITMGGGRPGQMGSLNIRGATTFEGRNAVEGAPLVLIDGVPGTLDRLSPEEVETVTVLKDAASAAIYGARGSLGVVLVTTKSGKAGKTSIRYNNSFGFATPTVSTDFITTGYDWMRLNDQALAHIGGYSGYTEQDYAELYARRNDVTENPDRPWVTIQNRNGKEQYVYYGNYDWWDIMFNKWQPNQNHNINISGGNDKLSYMINGNMKLMDGIMRYNTDKYKSYGVRSKITAKILPWLKFTNNTNFYNSNYHYYGRQGGGNANFVHINVHASPAYAPFNPDGTATYITGLNSYDIGDGIFAMLINGKTKGAEQKYELKTINEVVINPIKNMNITANYSYNMYYEPEFYRQVPARYSLYPGVTEIASKYSIDQLSENSQFNQVHVFNLFGDYEWKLGLDHNFKVLTGYNRELNLGKRTYESIQDLSSEDLNDLSLGSSNPTVDGSQYHYALEGYFYRLTYNYKSKYYFETNGRFDGSSRFPNGDRWGFFPSASAAWRVSQENFFASLKPTVSELKLRFSYGGLGNQQLPFSGNQNYYPYVSFMPDGYMAYELDGVRPKYYRSPDPVSATLTWERVKTINGGIDIGLFKNKLNLSFDKYLRTTSDILTGGLILPAVFGANAPAMNLGEMETKGFELTVNWRDQFMVANKPCVYRFGGVLGDNYSVVTNIADAAALQRLTYVLYPGKQIGEIWGYITDGYFKTDAEAQTYPINQEFLNRVRRDNNIPIGAGDLRWVDLDGDNIISSGKNTVDDPGDQRVIGNTTPRYSYSFNAGFNWAGFDFSVFFQGLGKKDWYPGNNADRFWGPYSRPYFSFLPKDFASDIWTPENPDAYFPTLVAYVALNSNNELRATNNKYLQNLAYLRLKNMTLGYSLPPALIKKAKLTNFRVFVSGENLFTWTKLRSKYIDPEQAIADGNGRVYPFSKIYSFGIDITF
ncbi:MAG: SusC/RagA family TonB-linked outer membrane protein [Niabella sp.]